MMIVLAMMLAADVAPADVFTTQRDPVKTYRVQYVEPFEDAAKHFCGMARWAIKTAQDPETRSIRLDPIPTTIEELNTLIAPPYGLDHRAATERLTFLIEGIVVGYKLEGDHDIHLVLKPPHPREKSDKRIVVEFPHADCTLSAPTPFRELMQKARADFLKVFRVGPKYKRPTRIYHVRIAGIGFFDHEHGQNGSADNAIELHPVLHFEVVDVHGAVPLKSKRRGKTRG
jgi:hypothetical protein